LVVVVVDDDPGTLKSVGRLLNVCGFVVRLFGSAEAFWAERSLIDADCLILDIHLNGMSGIDLRRELSRSGYQTPVIFLTADGSEVTRRLAERAGCMGYIEKPFVAATLVEALRKAIGTAS
jgi:FixJ family two-component response regulator